MALSWRRKVQPFKRPSFRPWLEILEGRQLPSTYMVTTNADSGAGSLRQAIADSNGMSGPNTIDFAIGSGLQTIQLNEALPAITTPVIVDATTQPAYTGTPLIVVIPNSPDIGTPGTEADGLDIETNGCTIQGLVIGGFANNLLLESNDNVIRGNFLGTNATGTGGFGPANGAGGTTGIQIKGGNNNTIGGTTSAARNVISDNNTGIDILGPLTTENNLIEGNFIGTDVTGDIAVGNNTGISTFADSDNTIGGTVPGAGNVISGNAGNLGIGLQLDGTADLIQGNKIGTNANGTVALGNAGALALNGNSCGVDLYGNGNTLGGATPGSGNVISGNGFAGLSFGNDASNSIVQGNFIGTDASGTIALENGSYGIQMTFGGSNNTIADNVISGNGDIGLAIGSFGAGPGSSPATGNILQGNRIGTNASGTMALPNGADGVVLGAASANTIGGTVAGTGNLISGNGAFGIVIAFAGAGADNNLIQGNNIGTDLVGTMALPNGDDGLYVIGSSNNSISGNLISGNGRFGVFLLGQATANGLVPSSNNLVQDNIIGLGQGGAGLANTDDGVALFAGATDNTIGGTTPGDGNLISGNYRFGIYLNGAGTSGNVIQGNRIGTSPAATFGQGNSFDGIAVFVGPTNNTVGGTTAGAGNIIAGNGRDGIFLANAGTSGNVVQGNLIGTNGSGTASLGHNGTGVAILVAPDNTVGGTAAGAGNVISGNLEGVVLIDSGASGNVVQGNRIGTDLSGSVAVPNSAFGVNLGGGASDNTVGGTVSGAGNTIAFNGSTGVVIGTSVSDATTVGDAVLGNAIYSNGGVNGLGIDLANDGVTANGPAGAARSGPNDLQNYPVFTPATASIANNSASATIRFGSLANSTFRLEFFLNSATDVSPQGRTFLGAVQVTTDANGNLATATALTTGVSVGTVNTGNNTVSVSLPVPSGTLTGSLTATATVLTVGNGQGGTVGDTSEFSAPALIGS